MADTLRTDILPSQITIENIDNFNQQTIDVIDEIEDTDIPTVQSKLASLRTVYNTQMRFISSSTPSSPKDGMGWFVLLD